MPRCKGIWIDRPERFLQETTARIDERVSAHIVANDLVLPSWNGYEAVVCLAVRSKLSDKQL